MKKQQGYQTVPFSANRRIVAAAVSIGQHNIQALIEVDVSKPRQLIRAHQQQTGEKLSMTAFIVVCLAQAIAEHPALNSFRKGRHLIMLDDVTIGVLLEREINGEMMPENLGIRAAQTKDHRQIHEEIRAAQAHGKDGLGGLTGTTWVRFIPGFLFRIFVRLASKSIRMAERFGAVAVTAVGMFGAKNQAMWLVPIVCGATVAVAVGGIVERPCINNGQLESREHLCLTVTFNHDIVDGAPVARFVKRFSELLKNGEGLQNGVGQAEVS